MAQINHGIDEVETGKRPLSAVAGSHLARLLVVIFAFLVVLESIFITIISMDMLAAEKVANREYEMVNASLDLLGTLRSARETWRAKSVAQDRNLSKSSLEDYEKCRQRFLYWKGKASASLLKMGVDKESVRVLDDKAENLDKFARSVFKATPETIDSAEDAYQTAGLECARTLLRETKAMHKIISTPLPVALVFGLEPLTVIYTAGVANFLVLLLIVIFVERSITFPIARLAAACELIKSKSVLPRPPQSTSEMGALQQSFYSMSLTIAEEEQRRRSYLEFLQSVQAATLMRVGGMLAEISAPASAKGRKTLDSARSNIGTLTNLVCSITETLSGGSVGQIKPKRVRTNLSEVVNNAKFSVEPLLQQRRISLELPVVDLSLEIDPFLIDRVMLNLISNAIKYSPEEATVRVTAERVGAANEFVRFNVIDSGPGIAAAQKEKLFQRFSQLEALDGVKRSGSGLGLVIAKEIVEAHGGHVGCDSEPGKGSCFWFSLPVQNGAESEASVRLAVKSTSGSDTAIPSKAKIGSIRGHLVLLLVLFLAVQGVLFFSLQGRMQEINQRTYSYTLEKERLLDSQELFSLFLAWAKQTERAMGKSDFMNVAKCVRLLRELAVRTERLAKSPRLDPEMAQQISRVLSEEEALLFVADATMADLSNARDSFPAVEKQVRNAYAKIDQAISRLMSLEADKFKSSFDWSQRLRTEILVILAVAAVFDVLIILSSVSYGLQVARRISLLRAKAESFAGGEQITPTLDKDDDLSFLDKRLCEAADSINESESQRLEMIAVINHDLRTPLTAVLNGFELMSLGLLGDISKEDSEKLELCEKDLQRLLNQVNDLLMIEKIDAGAFEPIIQSVSLHEIFENVKQKSMAAMVGKQILLSVLSDEVLSKAVVKGDKNLLQKLYAIVLDNAVAATPAGGSITVSFAESETSLISQIRDQGSGIEPSLLTNIFDRCRFLNDKPVTGLGLPLASRICRLQAGNIKLEPQPKGGIAVEITIPKAS